MNKYSDQRQSGIFSDSFTDIDLLKWNIRCVLNKWVIWEEEDCGNDVSEVDEERKKNKAKNQSDSIFSQKW